MGGCAALQNLYELTRPRNKEIFANAALIVTESNINEIHNHFTGFRQKLPISLIFRDLLLFYNELANLKKPVLILCLPECSNIDPNLKKLISKIHKFFAAKFGLNFIDIYEYYEQNDLISFGAINDGGGHQMGSMMSCVGKNIMKNLSHFKPPFKNQIPQILADFKHVTLENLENLGQKIEKNHMKNSVYDEMAFRLLGDAKLKFPKSLKNYEILGLSTWLNNSNLSLDFELSWVHGAHTSVIFENKKVKFSKEFAFIKQFIELQKPFVVDENSQLYLNHENLPYSENHVNVLTWHQNARKVAHADICEIFMARFKSDLRSNLMSEFERNDGFDYAGAIAKLGEINLPESLDFADILPDFLGFKDIVFEWEARIFPRKSADLNRQINEKNTQISNLSEKVQILENLSENLRAENAKNLAKFEELPAIKMKEKISNLRLKNELKTMKIAKFKKSFKKVVLTFTPLNSAKARVQNHLAYKLGQTAVICSKLGAFGAILTPFALIFTHKKHEFLKAKFEKNRQFSSNLNSNLSQNLPPLDSYPDFNEALKEKSCFTYRLGEAIIKARKTWHKGGFIKLFFEISKLKKEFGKA